MITYVVTVCVGLFCMNPQDTKFEYKSLNRCILKGYQLRFAVGHPLYVRTACRVKRTEIK
jgi:hypothetical protein